MNDNANSQKLLAQAIEYLKNAQQNGKSAGKSPAAPRLVNC